jgi:hypothetical protein
MGVKKTPIWGIDSLRKLRDKAFSLLEYFLPNSVQKEERMKPLRSVLPAVLFTLSLLLGFGGFALALEVGDKAPDFELDSTKGGKLKLSSLKGKNVLINFYVLDFSPT